MRSDSANTTNEKNLQKICVMLDKDQMELVEKLAAFLEDEANTSPTEAVISKAVQAYTAEKVRDIAVRYSIDVRSSTLTEMRQYRRETSVGVAARDTIILPIPVTAENRDRVYTHLYWDVPGLECDKLKGLHYAAIYWRTPVWGITHYANIVAADPCGNGGARIRFDHPLELGEPITPQYQENRLRRPRYTTLSLLLGAKTIEELFHG